METKAGQMDRQTDEQTQISIPLPVEAGDSEEYVFIEHILAENQKYLNKFTYRTLLQDINL